MEVREAIETQTARLAARTPRRTRDVQRDARGAWMRMEAAIEAGEEPADRRTPTFHTAIVQAARNPLPRAAVGSSLAEPIGQTRRASLARPGRPPKQPRGPSGLILGAIESKDEDGAAGQHAGASAVVGDWAS